MRHGSSLSGALAGLLIASVAIAVVACDSSTGGGTGGGGTGGSGTGAGGQGGGGTGGTDGGDGCHGDQAMWDMLSAGPVACTQSSDCCVIVNGCTNEAQIVPAMNKASAKAAWPYCDGDCTDCIPPAIQVGCENGACVGVAVPFEDAGADLLGDHCGVDPPVGAIPGKLHFSCGGG